MMIILHCSLLFVLRGHFVAATHMLPVYHTLCMYTLLAEDMFCMSRPTDNFFLSLQVKPWIETYALHTNASLWSDIALQGDRA